MSEKTFFEAIQSKALARLYARFISSSLQAIRDSSVTLEGVDSAGAMPPKAWEVARLWSHMDAAHTIQSYIECLQPIIAGYCRMASIEGSEPWPWTPKTNPDAHGDVTDPVEVYRLWRGEARNQINDLLLAAQVVFLRSKEQMPSTKPMVTSAAPLFEQLATHMVACRVFTNAAAIGLVLPAENALDKADESLELLQRVALFAQDLATGELEVDLAMMKPVLVSTQEKTAPAEGAVG